jgi:hypothetical protein
VRTHTAPVSGAGYFNYEFRGDLQPGQYFVTASNPSMKNIIRSTITIVPSNATSSPSTITSPVSTQSENVTVSPSLGISQQVMPSASTIPLSPLTVIAGLIFSGILVLSGSTGCRKKMEKNNLHQNFKGKNHETVLKADYCFSMISTGMYIGIHIPLS